MLQMPSLTKYSSPDIDQMDAHGEVTFYVRTLGK